jgi:hypothetical protein
MTKFRRVASLSIMAAILIAVPILYAYIWYARNDDSILDADKALVLAHACAFDLRTPYDDIHHFPESTNDYLKSLIGRDIGLAHFLECLSRDDLLRKFADYLRYFSIRINSFEEMDDDCEIAYKYSIIYYSRQIFIASTWRDSSFLTKRRNEWDSFILVRVKGEENQQGPELQCSPHETTPLPAPQPPVIAHPVDDKVNE